MTAASRPSGCARSAASTRVDAAPGARRGPPCPRWRRRADRCRAARRPRAPPDGPAPRSRSITMPTPPSRPSRAARSRRRRASDPSWRATSSRRPRAPARTRPFSGATSERSSLPEPSWWRAAITAMPWSPIVPVTMSTSPARAPQSRTERPVRPTPRRVDDDRRRARPCRITLVSPVTMAVPASRAGLRIDAWMRSSSSRGKPFLEHHRAGQPQRLGRAHHREIVHGAAHREPADVAAREERSAG